MAKDIKKESKGKAKKGSGTTSSGTSSPAVPAVSAGKSGANVKPQPAAKR